MESRPADAQEENLQENLDAVGMTFKRSLEEFLSVDDEMKRISNDSRELRKNKKILEDAISTHMIQNKLEERSFETSKVKVFKKKSAKNSFTKANVQQCAKTLFGAEGADSLSKMIEGLREITESAGIKRVKSCE